MTHASDQNFTEPREPKPLWEIEYEAWIAEQEAKLTELEEV